MKLPSVYLKMRVLGAVDTVEGRTRHERIHNVAAMTFLDEDGHPRQFTWRTIQTWFYRYKNHGITSMTQRHAGQGTDPQGHPRGTARSPQRRQAPLPPVIYYQGQRQGVARLLDAVANGLRRRKEQP